MWIHSRNKWLYPFDWRELTRVNRFGRAKGRCEDCGRTHGATIKPVGDGRWWDQQTSTWRNSKGRLILSNLPADGPDVRQTRVVLSTVTWTMIPPKVARAISRRYVSGVTSYATSASICGGARLPTECGKQLVICSAGRKSSYTYCPRNTGGRDVLNRTRLLRRFRAKQIQPTPCRLEIVQTPPLIARGLLDAARLAIGCHRVLGNPPGANKRIVQRMRIAGDAMASPRIHRSWPNAASTMAATLRVPLSDRMASRRRAAASTPMTGPARA